MYARLLTALLAALLAAPAGLVAAHSAIGSPTETDPYCERTRNGAPADYPGIGWYPPVLAPVDAALNGNDESDGADVPVGPLTVMACEGEHWDGQDSLEPETANDGQCTDQLVALERDTYIIAFRQCDDPAKMPAFVATNPVGVRAVAKGDQNNLNKGAVYLAVRIGNVGQAVLYAGGCHNALDPAAQYGHAGGERPCQGELGHGVLGAYLQDDTTLPAQNVLASIVTLARLTKGYVAESDCTMAEYQQSAWEVGQGRDATCGRDNTAITLEVLS